MELVKAHLSGMFPRSERLVEVTRARDRGGASDAGVESAVINDVRALVELQGQAGCDVLVDGQLNWQDLFRPFAKLLTGVQPGSLTRWFDNNTFYRKPVIVDRVSFAGKTIEEYFRSSLLPKEVPKKAILPGPYTFAFMSQNNTYSSFADLLDDLAHALKDIVGELRRANYEHFQFNEPCICSNSTTKENLELTKAALGTATEVAGAKSTVHTYFGDAGPVIQDLLDFPSDGIGLDFYATSIDSISQYDFDKELGCGCIDGRNSLLETPNTLAEFLGRINDEVNPKNMFICPNCDLEFLPRPIAEKKVKVLSETKNLAA